jgi:hypothetical protein
MGRGTRFAISAGAAFFYVLVLNALGQKLVHDWQWVHEGEEVRALIVDKGDAAGSEQREYTVRYGDGITAYGVLSDEFDVGDTLTVQVRPGDPFEVRTHQDVWMEVILGAPLTAALVVGAPPILYWVIWKRRPKPSSATDGVADLQSPV